VGQERGGRKIMWLELWATQPGAEQKTRTVDRVMKTTLLLVRGISMSMMMIMMTC